MIESIQLGNQKTDCRCLKKVDVLVEVIASSLSSVRAAKEENLRDIHDHQALVHASAFLRKKYEENLQSVPSRSQLDSYVAEFKRGSYSAAVNAVILLTIPTEFNQKRLVLP
jgi:hypothetical protein